MNAVVGADMSPLINGKVTSFQAYEDTAELVEAFRKKVTKRKDNCRDKHSTGATKRRFGCMAMAKKLARMKRRDGVAMKYFSRTKLIIGSS